MSAESEKDAQARWILKQDPAVCTCKPGNPKHREGWQCVTAEQLGAYKMAAPPPWPTFTSDQKRQAWLWLWFSQHPEAKKLTGRDEEGLDAWDDAAGMTELQKWMFT
jgi:hypothetical protein